MCENKKKQLCIALFLAFFNPFPNDKFLDLSKLKEFADDNLIFDEDSIKFSRDVETTEGKGEIAHKEHFLLFPQFFQKTYMTDTSLFGKG